MVKKSKVRKPKKSKVQMNGKAHKPKVKPRSHLKSKNAKTTKVAKAVPASTPKSPVAKAVKAVHVSTSKLPQPVRSSTPPQLNLSVFYEDYIPQKMVVRDEQVRQIKDAIDNFIKSGISSNLLLQGVTGSGKTSTLQFALRDYDKGLYTLVKCKELKGVKEVLEKIGNMQALARERATDIQPKVIENLKKNRKLIILDDVTQVSAWPELMNYLDGIYRAAQTPIFVTTNLYPFVEILALDVRHTLLFFRVDFPHYGVEELTAIMQDRVEASGAQLPYAAIHMIATLSSEVGSARDALVMCRTAIQTGKHELDQIRELYRALEEQTYVDYVRKLAPREKEVLEFIINEFKKTKEPIPIREVTKGVMLSPSRTSQLVSILEQYGVIATKQVYTKDGNFRIIEPDRELVGIAERKQALLES